MKVQIVPDLSKGRGGPAAFQNRLLLGLRKRGVDASLGFSGCLPDAVLVINACREMTKLIHAKRRSTVIIQRLGGINWIHRRKFPGLIYFSRSELINCSMAYIRRYLADHVIYQSKFVERWWENSYGATRVPCSIIYNGVDLSEFSPIGPRLKPRSEISLISVEGTQGTDPGNIAVNLLGRLRERGINAGLLMFGRVNSKQKELLTKPFVNYKGHVTSESLPSYYRSSHLFISTDVIAACPNSVIEALACGVPVVGFSEGALPELVPATAGTCVSHGNNAWLHEPPGNMEGLTDAAVAVLSNQSFYRNGARAFAELNHDVEKMTERYLKVITQALDSRSAM